MDLSDGNSSENSTESNNSQTPSNLVNVNEMMFVELQDYEDDSEDEHIQIVVNPTLGDPLVHRQSHNGICNAPVLGESFCQCVQTKGRDMECDCGEDQKIFEWVWDEANKTAASNLRQENREVRFHAEYSSGTAAIRGTDQLENGKQHYWEIKMITPVYGTDVMVGVSTSKMNMERYRYNFFSLLGSDAESWGLSYTGALHHGGKSQSYSGKFGQGSIIGVHLDSWNGILSFYKNKQPLGVAYTNMKNKQLYPTASSTAARSGMKLVRSQSFKTNLLFMCCQALRKMIPAELNVLDVINVPPGLKAQLEYRLSWLLCSKAGDMPERKELPDPESHLNLPRISSVMRGGTVEITIGDFVNDVGAASSVKKRKRDDEDDESAPSTSAKHMRMS